MGIDISYKQPGQFEETRDEKIHNVIVLDSTIGSVCVAIEIANLIRKKQDEGKLCVFGLATGSTPIKVYEELVRMHKDDGLSFSNVVTFNLDEYYPMNKSSTHSYFYFMHQHLFHYVDILPENIHIPDGTITPEELETYCLNYESKIDSYGGLDFQLLGIGKTGHIGFNEPGSHYNSKTRNITLDPMTRMDAAPSFSGIEDVPKSAITMGVGTVRKTKRIVLLAWGQNKASIIKETIEGTVSSKIPATYLQEHSNTTFILDEEAAEDLSQFKTP